MNLWADLDNNQHPPLIATRHARRLTEQAVLSILRDWLLNEYVASYCRSLATTRIFRRCYWIDGLGIEERAVPLALQPVIALSQTLSQESKPIALHGLLLEAGSSTRKDARAMKAAQNGANTSAAMPVKALSIPQESGIVRASWLEAAPALLDSLDQSPAIFLLNPFGPTMFTAEDLELLYQRKVPTELCLHIAHRQVESRLLAAHRSAAHATTLTGLLRTDRWKTLSTNEEEMAQSVTTFIEFFVAAMQKHFLLPVQRVSLPVHIRPAVMETVPYTLLFATRRQDSLMSMNDALCCYRRRVDEHSHRGVLAEEWFMKQQREQYIEAIEQLYQRALQRGRAQRIRRWPDLRQQLLLDHFGQFTQQEYDQVILRLLANQEVRCQWRRSPQPGGEERTPGTDGTLIW